MDKPTAYSIVNSENIEPDSDLYKEALQYLQEHSYDAGLKKYLKKLRLTFNHKNI